jgi:hypothetical protein
LGEVEDDIPVHLPAIVCVGEFLEQSGVLAREVQDLQRIPL